MSTSIRMIPIKAPNLRPPSHFSKAADRHMREWQGRVIRKVAKYPPQGSSSYQRTGTLGRNWRTRLTFKGANLEATVENPTPYAVWVQGPYSMAGPHQTSRMAARGWTNLGIAATEEWKATEKQLRDLLGDIYPQRGLFGVAR